MVFAAFLIVGYCKTRRCNWGQRTRASQKLWMPILIIWCLLLSLFRQVRSITLSVHKWELSAQMSVTCVICSVMAAVIEAITNLPASLYEPVWTVVICVSSPDPAAWLCIDFGRMSWVRLRLVHPFCKPVPLWFWSLWLEITMNNFSVFFPTVQERRSHHCSPSGEWIWFLRQRPKLHDLC